MSTTENRNSDLITTTQAGRLLGVTKITVNRLIHRGELPAFRFGKHFRVRRADVDQYLEASRYVPASAAKGAK